MTFCVKQHFSFQTDYLMKKLSSLIPFWAICQIPNKKTNLMRIPNMIGWVLPILIFVFAQANTIQAQCTISPNGGSVSLPVSLSSAGTATINAGLLTPYIGWSCVSASPMLQFSMDAAFTAPSNGSISLNCSHVGASPASVWVRAIDVTNTPTVAVLLSVNVTDDQDPVITCPANITMPAPVGFCNKTVTYAAATYVDNCINMIDYSHPSGGTFPVGTTTVTATAEDPEGNTDDCTFTITVTDTELPIITCPFDMTVNAGAMCTANPTFSATVTDNCTATVVYTPASGSSFALGTTPVMAVATDPALNSASCSFNVTVEDNTDPAFSVASFLEYEADSLNCVAIVNYVITSDSLKDNCSSFAAIIKTMSIDYSGSSSDPNILNVAYNPALLTTFPFGLTKLTFEAEDLDGNVSTKVVNIDVIDTSLPTFNPYPQFPISDSIWCGRNFVLPNTTNACSNSFTWRRPNLNYTDVDDCRQFDVTEVVTPNSVSVAINSSAYDYLGSAVSATVTAQVPVGLTTMTYTATDFSGNVTTCSFTVTVNDTQAPTILCPPNTTLSTTCVTGAVPDYRNGVNVMDNCGAAITIVQTPAQGTTLSALAGTIGAPNTGDMFPINMLVSDGPNTVNCSFTVTLDDGSAPVPVLIPLPTRRDSCGILTINAPVAMENCNPLLNTVYGTASIVPATGVSFTPGSGSTPPRYTFGVGAYSVVWTYDDGNGNQTTQNQLITVLADTFPPVALCNSLITVPLQADGDTIVSPNLINNGSYDPNMCGLITTSLSKTFFNCSNIDTNNVVLTVRDVNGRTATCNAKIVIRDVTPPVLVGVPADITLTSCDIIPLPASVTAKDSCTAPVVPVFTTATTRMLSGCGKYNYSITRRWTATDASMNSVSATQIITVNDEAPSFAMVPDSIVVLTGPNRTTCNDTVRLNYQTLVKDCIPNLTFTLTGGTFPGVYGVGNTFVNILATDSCGNNANKTVKVVVKDGTPPSAVCINGLSTTVGPGGQAVITQSQINNNSFDNCSSPITVDSIRYIFDCADADGVTQHPVSITVRDAAGNFSTCNTYVIVQDNVGPIVVCPANITVQCNQSILPASTGSATATDNCQSTLAAPIYTDTQVTGGVGTCSVITRQWKATDLFGNIGTCNQTITVQDLIAPSIAGVPANDTIECYKNLPPVPSVTGSDNCDLSVAMTFVQDTLNKATGTCGKYNYTVRRTWTATDDCGQVTTRSYFIMVRDTVRPSFPGMPDTIRVNSADYPTLTTCAIPYFFDAYNFLSECADSVNLIVGNTAPLGNGKFRIAGNYMPGTYKVRFDITDPCGNFGRDSIVFIFRDNTAPTMVCQTSIDVALGTNGTGVITPADINIGTVDNCGILSLVLSKTSFNCANLGQNQVTLTATDVNNNVNTCIANVNVLVGSSSTFTATVTGSPTSYFGASNGTATAVVTGAGAFTYAWSNMATTATLTNVPAGTYTVTISNTTSGCVLIDTAVVAQGPRVKIVVADVIASVGQTIFVPVTVSQFNNVNSFSFSLNSISPSVAIVSSLVNIHPSVAPNLISSIVGNVISVAWVDPGGTTLLNLPANTVIFDIQATTLGAPNTSTDIIVGAGATLPFEVIQQFGSTSVVVPVETMDGSISISSSALNQVGGLIATWVNPDNPASVAKPVANVAVNSGILGITNDTTATDGLYNFSVPTASNSLTTPTKFTAGNTGVTSADLLRIINHIFGTVMTSPYQLIAANANNDTIISLGDYLKIQRLVLGTVQHLDADPDWIFIPKSFVFPTTGNILKVAYPKTIGHTPVLLNYTTDDFVAVRRGDVNGNGPVTIVNQNADDRYDSSDALHLEVVNQDLTEGSVISVPFYANGFKNRQAFQTTFGFDSKYLQFEGVTPGKLEIKSSDFGTSQAQNGLITTAWVSHKSTTVDNGEVLFTLNFKVNQGGKTLSEILTNHSQITRSESYLEDGSTTPVQLSFRTNGQLLQTFDLLQSRPNPSKQSVVIGFTLPEHNEATLRILNVEGRVVRTIKQDYAPGYHQIILHKDEIGGNGVYFYELSSESFTARRKMIFID
jgi:hypothetical protein